MTWEPDICIYHFPCDDGFGAAWAVWKKWGDEVEWAPRNYGQEPPPVAGRNVLIADFSFPLDMLMDMAVDAKSVVVLDHHKTAKEDLGQLPSFDLQAGHDHPDLSIISKPNNLYAYFDMEKSGAMLAWLFCNPGNVEADAPQFVKYLQDRDLWRFEYPETRAFSLFLRSYPFDFGTWYAVEHRLTYAREQLLGEAEGIERFYDRKIEEICDAVTWKKIGKHEVPVANAPHAFASDVAHELLQRNPGAPFAATRYENHGAVTYSLRSEDSREDVSEIARQFGGGGHRNAAGFRVPA